MSGWSITFLLKMNKELLNPNGIISRGADLTQSSIIHHVVNSTFRSKSEALLAAALAVSMSIIP